MKGMKMEYVVKAMSQAAWPLNAAEQSVKMKAEILSKLRASS